MTALGRRGQRDAFDGSYHNRLAGVLSCYDRIVITGTLPGACFAEGMTKILKARGIRVSNYARSSRRRCASGCARRRQPSSISPRATSVRKTSWAKFWRGAARILAWYMSFRRWRRATGISRGTISRHTAPSCAPTPASVFILPIRLEQVGLR